MSNNYDPKVLTIKKKTSQPSSTSKPEESATPVNVSKKVAALLTKTRNIKGKNQKEVGTTANIGAAVLSQWELGTAIWCDGIAKKICKALDIKFEDLKRLQDHK